MYVNDVIVDAGNLVGEENEGFKRAMDGFNRARVLVSAACIGAAEAVLETGLEHLKNRDAFGHKLKDFQSLSFEAADLATRLEMARLLTLEAAWTADGAESDESHRDRAITLAAMAKLTGPQAAHDVMKSVVTSSHAEARGLPAPLSPGHPARVRRQRGNLFPDSSTRG